MSVGPGYRAVRVGDHLAVNLVHDDRTKGRRRRRRRRRRNF
jgi:hypothetical protein